MTEFIASNFNRLIGTWKTSGQFSTQDKVCELTGIDTYEFVLERNYILHKANVTIDKENSETFEMICLDNRNNNARMQYFNSKGESGLMTSTITNNDFIIKGDRIKFKGTINNENSIIVGKWYLQTNDKTWQEFINIKLEKYFF